MRRRPTFRLRVLSASTLVALHLSACATGSKEMASQSDAIVLQEATKDLESEMNSLDDATVDAPMAAVEAKPVDTRNVAPRRTQEAPKPEPTQAPAAPISSKRDDKVMGGKKTNDAFAEKRVHGDLVKPKGTSAPSPQRMAAVATANTTGPGAQGGVMAPPPPSMDRRDELPKEESTTSGNTHETQVPNRFTQTAEDRFSTFAIDVDTASYSLARRQLNSGALPPASGVRVEEFVNYFRYKYPAPQSGAFAVHLDGAPSPFGRGKHLLKVGVQGKTLAKSQRKPANLVFLVDVSGSMASSDKLPLVKEALNVLVKNLNENDTVSLVTYAGHTAEILPTTPATDTKKISAAINSLGAGGGTAMGSGFQRAYENAMKRVGGGVNSRVIVMTDGDTNIGPNLTADSMLESVRKYVSEGVTLSTVGFGMGNYRDDLMEKLANKGNGNCFYIDTLKEARKVFEAQIAGTLEVIAKDVKIQVDFNPETVKAYRLVGYENRDIADRDFRNDKVDAGEIGAGHTVTALYEVELTGAKGDLATVRVRAKEPTGSVAREQEFRFGRDRLYASMDSSPADFRFATAVAGTADILRGNPAAEGWSLAMAQSLAEGATEGLGDRKEFAHLVAQARRLMGEKNVSAQR